MQNSFIGQVPDGSEPWERRDIFIRPQRRRRRLGDVGIVLLETFHHLRTPHLALGRLHVVCGVSVSVDQVVHDGIEPARDVVDILPLGVDDVIRVRSRSCLEFCPEE